MLTAGDLPRNRATRDPVSARNRALWDQVSDQFAAAEELARWDDEEITWGLTRTPEAVVAALDDVAGRDVVDVGCGVAHLSGWLARRSARVVALDLSAAQLAAAQRAQAARGIAFPLVLAEGGRLPLVDRCADLVISEHAAAAWCEPREWIGEAARVLRPGGRLVFLTNSPLSAMCVPAEGGPAGERLLRGPSELWTVEWPGGGVEHHPSHGEWIAVLTEQGFVVEGLHELRAAEGEVTTASTVYGIAEATWAARWPIEDLWVARLASPPS